jgi:hypothetical protein
VGFGPAQAEADAQAGHFRGGIHGTWIFSHVEARDTNLAGTPAATDCVVRQASTLSVLLVGNPGRLRHSKTLNRWPLQGDRPHADRQ